MIVFMLHSCCEVFMYRTIRKTQTDYLSECFLKVSQRKVVLNPLCFNRRFATNQRKSSKAATLYQHVTQLVPKWMTLDSKSDGKGDKVQKALEIRKAKPKTAVRQAEKQVSFPVRALTAIKQEAKKIVVKTFTNAKLKKVITDKESTTHAMSFRDRLKLSPEDLTIAEYEAQFLELSGEKLEKYRVADVWLQEPALLFQRPKNEWERIRALGKLRKLKTLRSWNKGIPRESASQAIWRLGGCHPDWHKTWFECQKPQQANSNLQRRRVFFESCVLEVRDLLQQQLLIRFGRMKHLEVELLKLTEVQKVILKTWAEYLVRRFERPLAAATPYYLPTDNLLKNQAFKVSNVQECCASNAGIYWLVRRISRPATEDGVPSFHHFPKVLNSDDTLDYPLDEAKLKDLRRFYSHMKWPFVPPCDKPVLKNKLC